MEPFLRKIMFQRYIHLCLRNKEIKKGRFYWCGQKWGEGFQGDTGHPITNNHYFIFLTSTCSSRNVILGYNNLKQPFNMGKVFCPHLEPKTAKFFLNSRRMMVAIFCNQAACLNPSNILEMTEVQQYMEFLRKYIYRNRMEKMGLLYFREKKSNNNGLGIVLKPRPLIF